MASSYSEISTASLTDTVVVVGPIGPAHSFDVSISGTFVGTLALQRFIGNGTDGNWRTVKSYTGPIEDSPSLHVRKGIARIKFSAYTSGTAVVTLQATDAAMAPAPNNVVAFDQTIPGTTDSVSVKSQGYKSAVSLTRTNDTNAYTANDVIGAATGSTAALTFANIGPVAGGEILITTVKMEVDVTAIPSGMTGFRLYFYDVTPPSALGDNAAWDLPSGDRASFKGYVDLGSPVDLGSTLYVETNGYNKQITVPAGGSLFGYLVTNGGYTPAASVVKKITLHATAV